MGKLSSGRPSQAAHRAEIATRAEIANGRATRADAIKDVLATLPAPKFEEHSTNRQRTYPEKLKPWHHLMLIKLLEGQKLTQIAADLGKSVLRCTQVSQSPLFKSLFDAIVQKRYESVVEGEHGVVAQARAEAPQATIRLIQLSKTAKESVRLDAIKHVLALAGAAPVVRTETYSLDKLIEQMDRRELEIFSTTGRVPRRFAEMLAQMGRNLPFSDESDAIEVDSTPSNMDDDDA